MESTSSPSTSLTSTSTSPSMLSPTIKVRLFSYLYMKQKGETYIDENVNVTWFPDYRLTINSLGEWTILAPNTNPKYLTLMAETGNISPNHITDLTIPDENNLSMLLTVFVTHIEQVEKMRVLLRGINEKLHEGQTTNLIKKKIPEESTTSSSTSSSTSSYGQGKTCIIS